ncbi:putative ribonuclease H-like domain-containing protein [Tanacetum coccineum]
MSPSPPTTATPVASHHQHHRLPQTPQQNGVAERRDRTLIEAARTMLADSKLPTTFWAEAVSTAWYIRRKQSRLHCDANLERYFIFNSPTKNVDNGEPKTADDAQKQVEDGLNNENCWIPL